MIFDFCCRGNRVTSVLISAGSPEAVSVQEGRRGARGPVFCILLGVGTGTWAEPPRGPSHPPAQQPDRDRRRIGGQSLLLSFLLSQTRLKSHTGMDTPFLPSSCGFFFFLGSSLPAHEAVGSRDRNKTLWLAESYRVKTTPSSRELGPPWPFSKSPKRAFPWSCKSCQHPCWGPGVTVVCVLPVSRPSPRQPHAHPHLSPFLRSHLLCQ